MNITRSFAIVFLIFLLSTENNKCCAMMSEEMIVDFLNAHHLNVGVIFHCEGERVGGWRKLTSELKFYVFCDVRQVGANLEQIMKLKLSHVGVILDGDCDSTKDIFDKFSNLNFFNESYHWLITTNETENLIEILKTQNINLDSDITIAKQVNESIYELHDIYNPSFKYGGNLIITRIGLWNESGSKILKLPESKVGRRLNLQGLTIPAGVVATNVKEHESFIEHLESCEDKFIDTQHRHGYRLFKYLEVKNNFSMFLRRTSLWGIQSSIDNESYNGILGMFQKDEIEVSVSPLRATLDRVDICDMIGVTWITTGAFVFRHPKNALRNIFLQPLCTMVWIVLMMMIFLFTVFITIVMRHKVKTANMMRSWIIAIGIIAQQGIIENSRRLSMRILFYSLIVFSMIIYQYYSSFIVSSLLTDPPKSIDSIRKLIDSDLKVGIEDLTYNHDFFDKATDKETLELYTKKVKKGNQFYSQSEGVEMMKKGGFAFHFDTSYGYGLIKDSLNDDEICELQEILLYEVRPLAIAVHKKSPLRDFFAVSLLKLKENGIHDYYTKQFAFTKPKCAKSIAEIKSVGINDAYFIFLFLGSSMIFALGILMFELFLFHCNKTSKLNRILRI